MDASWNVEISIIIWIQSLGGWLAAPMLFFTYLGRPEFYLLVIPALYWCLDKRLGLRLAYMLLLSSSVNEAAKIAFHSPRPYWVSRDVRVIIGEQNFGLPSGHAQHAVSLLGLLGILLRRRWVWWVLIPLILLISLSRLYLGVHFPRDVLGGWIIGGLILWAFVRWEGRVSAAFQRRNAGQQVLIGLLASLALIGLSGLALFTLRSWQAPLVWAENALAGAGSEISPLSLMGILDIAGLFFGLTAGLALLTSQGGFNLAGSTGRRLVRYPLGLAGVALLWFGTEIILPQGADWPSYILGYLRAALLGLWIAWGAPMVFIRLRLAEHEGV